MRGTVAKKLRRMARDRRTYRRLKKYYTRYAQFARDVRVWLARDVRVKR